ncbi:hypothetical protein CR513_41181, partial [Mucuna pruriens]
MMTNTIYGMIHTYGDIVMIKLFVGAFLTSRSIWSSNFVMQHLEAANMDQLGQPRKCLITSSIGPPFSGMPINLSPPMKNAKKLEWPLAEGISCPNSLYCSTKSLMCGVLTSRDQPQSPMEAIATKTNDAKVIVDFLKSNIFCRFGVLKALISDQGSHFCNRAMSSLHHKYGVVNRIVIAYHPQTNGKVMRHRLCIFYRPKKGGCMIILTEPKSHQPRESSQPRLTSSKPNKGGPMALSTSTIQLRGHLSSKCHVTIGETCVLVCALLSETGKPKSIRGDSLGFQFTLVDLILNARAIGGEPPPSTMASSTDPLYAFDPKIERTLHRLRKARNLVVNNSRNSGSAINSNQFATNIFVASFSHFAKPRQMENNDRTLKELATLDVVYQPWCIQYPQLEPAQIYELKSGLIHLLPKFHGLAREDPTST